MTSFGFISSDMDPCVFLKETTNSIITALLYVDDILLMSNKIEDLNKISLRLGEKFKIKDLGSP